MRLRQPRFPRIRRNFADTPRAAPTILREARGGARPWIFRIIFHIERTV